MIFAINFDGTVVQDSEPLTLVPGAKRALQALKAADHVLLLYSSRANLAERIDPNFNPLVRAKRIEIDIDHWRKHEQPVAEKRYQDMLAFVEKQLPGLFDAIDDGVQGKPVADIFLDAKAWRLAHGGELDTLDWRRIAQRYGDE